MLKAIWRRVRRGLREDMRVHVVAFSSLLVAFFCLAMALVVLTNLLRLESDAARQAQMTIYLRDTAKSPQLDQLRAVLGGFPEVESYRHLTPTQARQQLLRSLSGSELSQLPVELFPNSLEVRLVHHVTVTKVKQLATRLRRLNAVDDVETYQDWHQKFHHLSSMGRSLSAVLAVLVFLCAVAVVGNTIRLVVARRRDEIEIAKLCGATDGFVMAPFVLEGAFQGLLSCAAALVGAAVVFTVVVSSRFGLGSILGNHLVFLGPLSIAAMLALGAAMGSAGSALALRRYLHA